MAYDFERITLMKKLLLLLLCIVHCALCIDLRAQDDAESIVSGDIEVEGLDDFWVESRLITDIDKITPSASLVPLKQGENMRNMECRDTACRVLSVARLK